MLRWQRPLDEGVYACRADIARAPDTPGAQPKWWDRDVFHDPHRALDRLRSVHDGATLLPVVGRYGTMRHPLNVLLFPVDDEAARKPNVPVRVVEVETPHGLVQALVLEPVQLWWQAVGLVVLHQELARMHRRRTTHSEVRPCFYVDNETQAALAFGVCRTGGGWACRYGKEALTESACVWALGVTAGAREVRVGRFRPHERILRACKRDGSALGKLRAIARRPAGVAPGRFSQRRSASTARSSPSWWRSRKASMTLRSAL